MVLLIEAEGRGLGPRVGASWQPDVAQFLLEMVPHALDYGLNLSDIVPLIGEDDDELWDEDDIPFGEIDDDFFEDDES